MEVIICEIVDYIVVICQDNFYSRNNITMKIRLQYVYGLLIIFSAMYLHTNSHFGGIGHVINCGGKYIVVNCKDFAFRGGIAPWRYLIGLILYLPWMIFDVPRIGRIKIKTYLKSASGYRRKFFTWGTLHDAIGSNRYIVTPVTLYLSYYTFKERGTLTIFFISLFIVSTIFYQREIKKAYPNTYNFDDYEEYPNQMGATSISADEQAKINALQDEADVERYVNEKVREDSNKGLVPVPPYLPKAKIILWAFFVAAVLILLTYQLLHYKI